MFCINKPQIAELLKRLKSGEITPEKLMEFENSQARRDYFASFLGEANAQKVNALVESKFLLKDQQTGIQNAVNKILGLSPEVKRDIISKTERMTEILSPKDMQSFLEDAVAKKMGFGVTFEQAGKLTEMSRQIMLGKEKMGKDFTFGSFDDRLALGRNMVDFMDYVSAVKSGNQPISVGGSVKQVLGVAKSLKSSLDNSVIFLQGFKSMATETGIWAKNSVKTFEDIVKTFGGAETLREVRAEIMTRPNALNGIYAKERLAVGIKEESYPTSWLEKIPGVGKAFKASEAAFVGFQYRTRADIADRYIDLIKKSGGDIKGVGLIANSLTGRGGLGSWEGSADKINLVFFSPRNLKSHFDVMTGHTFDGKKVSPELKKIAAVNALKIIAAQAMIRVAANALVPGSAENDPRSADFGKIRVGDTRFDVSGGMGSVQVLVARLAMALAQQPAMKSSTTGIVTKLNSGKFGAPTALDTVENFFQNKLSPGASLIVHLLEGKDFNGKPLTFVGEARSLFEPFPSSTLDETLSNPRAANILVTMLASSLGLNTSTYSAGKDWNLSSSDEMKQFKAKVGDQKFNEISDSVRAKFNTWFDKAKNSAEYTKLSEDDKLDVIQKKQTELKKDVFSQYYFKPAKKPKKVLPNI